MLDPESRLPLYHQVETRLREDIQAGRLRVGEAIPPERELIAQFGVSRITIRQALANLAAEGLLIRRQGRGTFVAGTRDRAFTESLANLTGHLEELQLRGLDPEVKILALARRALPADAAAALARPEGEEAGFVRRLVWVGHAPLMLSEIWLPASLGVELTPDLAAAEGMAPLLTRLGQPPRFGRQRIGAEPAAPEPGRLLEVRPGDPVLRVTRVLYGEGERPLAYLRTLYRADRYEYAIELRRLNGRH